MQLLRFYIVCDGCGCNYYVFILYAIDVGAITRFLHCDAMDVGAITRFLHRMRWMWVQLLGFYIVCHRCGCNC